MNINIARRTWAVGVMLLFCSDAAQAGNPLDPWAVRWVDYTVLHGVTYGAGMFVAGSGAGDCYRSPDGVCWTEHPLDVPARNGLRSVAYGNGRFVALEPSSSSRPSAAYVSTDGILWRRSADLPKAQQPILQRVFFAGERFLAVYNESNAPPDTGAHLLLMSSPDGAEWSRHTGPTNAGTSFSCNSVAFGNGVYVVAGRAGLLASTDLSNWTQVFESPLNVINDVTYGNGRFVAVGFSSLGLGQFEAATVTSTNGVDWTARLLGIPGRLNAVACGADQSVAVGEPRLLLSSSNALDWTQHPANVDVLSGVTFGADSFIAVGGFITALARSVALQSGGQPQMCLQALGVSQSSDPRFTLSLTLGPDRAYRLQSSPDPSAAAWTDIANFTLPPAGWVEPRPFTDPIPATNASRFYRLVSP